MPVIDAHAHLETRMLEPAAIIAKMDASGIDRVALIPTMNDPLPSDTPAALLALFRGLMTSRLHPLAPRLANALMTEDGDLKLRGKVFKIYARPDNATVAAAIEAYPERFVGWIFLNPRLGDALEELERWRSVPGFVGVKLHPHWHRYPLHEALPVAKRCEDLGLPMLIHLGFGEHGGWQLLAARCPKLVMIFAHAGMPHFQRMWDYVRDDPRLYVDVSSPYLSERLVRRAVAVMGAERVLYGTDAPYGAHAEDGTYDYTNIKGWVERLPNRAPEIDRVLGENVERLLQLR